MCREWGCDNYQWFSKIFIMETDLLNLYLGLWDTGIKHIDIKRLSRMYTEIPSEAWIYLQFICKQQLLKGISFWIRTANYIYVSNFNIYHVMKTLDIIWKMIIKGWHYIKVLSPSESWHRWSSSFSVKIQSLFSFTDISQDDRIQVI